MTDDLTTAAGLAPEPEVSLIVCTRNRAAKLAPCLAALAAIRHDGPWELILVDNGSTDGTAAVLEAFHREAPVPVRLIHEPRKGLANARNAGLAAARGAVAAFTDDDCYAAPDLVTRAAEVFADPEVGFVGGRIRLFDPDDIPVTIMESTVPKRFAPGSFIRTGEIQGANMAFRRSALEQAGGFDPLFGSGAFFPAEDIDAVAAVSRLGWAGAYDPRLVVFHHHGRREADLPRLTAEYDRGRGAYHMKLLLGRGAVRAYVQAQKTLLRRMPREPRSALRELMAGLEYAWRSALRS
ncbi:MAG: glycosyltransferase [Phenylobacterium sp.]|uniref:glycosyltransferase n=1 Tax=Phenylobacterium sp. TaxID=1871053 RepID=UPI003919F5AD